MKEPAYLRLVKLTLELIGGIGIFALILYLIVGKDDHERWAHFGDYISGVLDPMFAFANLVLLIVISYQIADRDDKRNLKLLQHQAYQDFLQLFDQVPELIAPETQEQCFKLRAIKLSYSSWVSVNKYLFPGIIGPRFLAIQIQFEMLSGETEYYQHLRDMAGDNWLDDLDTLTKRDDAYRAYLELTKRRKSLEKELREHISRA